MVPLFYKKVNFLMFNRKMTSARKLIFARIEPEYSFKRRLKEMRSLMLGLEALPKGYRKKRKLSSLHKEDSA